MIIKRRKSLKKELLGVSDIDKEYRKELEKSRTSLPPQLLTVLSYNDFMVEINNITVANTPINLKTRAGEVKSGLFHDLNNLNEQINDVDKDTLHFIHEHFLYQAILITAGSIAISFWIIYYF